MTPRRFCRALLPVPLHLSLPQLRCLSLHHWHHHHGRSGTHRSMVSHHPPTTPQGVTHSVDARLEAWLQTSKLNTLSVPMPMCLPCRDRGLSHVWRTGYAAGRETHPGFVPGDDACTAVRDCLLTAGLWLGRGVLQGGVLKAAISNACGGRWRCFVEQQVSRQVLSLDFARRGKNLRMVLFKVWIHRNLSLTTVSSSCSQCLPLSSSVHRTQAAPGWSSLPHRDR